MKFFRFGLLLGFAITGVVDAQSPVSLERPPPPQAATISSAEIQAAVKQNSPGAFSDSVLRVLSIESKYNVGVSVVRRSQVDGKTPADAIVHDAITEVYQIIEGNGVLVTGGSIEAPTALPSNDPDVLKQIGPSSVGKRIVGGIKHDVGPGDIVVIPPHTAHGFVQITTKRIVYTLIRIDPHRLLEIRNPSF